jgi:hypothetical protein
MKEYTNSVQYKTGGQFLTALRSTQCERVSVCSSSSREKCYSIREAEFCTNSTSSENSGSVHTVTAEL